MVIIYLHLPLVNQIIPQEILRRSHDSQYPVVDSSRSVVVVANNSNCYFKYCSPVAVNNRLFSSCLIVTWPLKEIEA